MTPLVSGVNDPGSGIGLFSDGSKSLPDPWCRVQCVMQHIRSLVGRNERKQI